MRLIDVDALLSKNCIALKGPNDGEYDSCSECLGEPYGYCCMEMKGDEIYNAPTIDAIPVEWLIKRREQLRQKEYGDLGVAAITKVLKYWYEEQESEDSALD